MFINDTVFAQTGTLKIVTNAAGSIKIDGENKGSIEANAVKKFDLKADDYIVQFFSQSGSSPITKEVSIQVGKSETINFEVSVPNQQNNSATNSSNLLLPEMVFVQGGTFTMGCTAEQGSDCTVDKKLAYGVTLSSYHIGKYEVTFNQFRLFIERTGYRTDADKEGWSNIWNGTAFEKNNGVNWQYNAFGNKRSYTEDNHPVIHVSWNDAEAYCEWLSKESGKTYRLPTQAEFEYAARGGYKSKAYRYSGSNDINNVAWYSDNSGGKTHIVGQKAANELGVYDMSGNVSEWCSDWYRDSYYSSPVNNPQGPSSGSNRVLRGGNWLSIEQVCRVSYRGSDFPNRRAGTIGFRLVLVP